MRHSVAGYKLSRNKNQRTALRTTMVRQLFEHERITTTFAKAHSVRNLAEKLITIAKKGNSGDLDGKEDRRTEKVEEIR